VSAPLVDNIDQMSTAGARHFLLNKKWDEDRKIVDKLMEELEAVIAGIINLNVLNSPITAFDKVWRHYYWSESS
jgi:hypothetical protein